jgi:hypothetical protein
MSSPKPKRMSSNRISNNSESWFTKGSRWYVYLTSVLPILLGLILIISGIYMLFHHTITYVPDGSIKVDSATIVDYSCGSTMSEFPCQVTIDYSITGKYQNRVTIPTHDHYKVGDSVIVCVSSTDNSKVTRVGQLPTVNPWILIGFGSAIVLLMVGNNLLVSRSSTAANVEGGLAAFNIVGKSL